LIALRQRSIVRAVVAIGSAGLKVVDGKTGSFSPNGTVSVDSFRFRANDASFTAQPMKGTGGRCRSRRRATPRSTPRR